jgi:hypothetical protein
VSSYRVWLSQDGWPALGNNDHRKLRSGRGKSSPLDLIPSEAHCGMSYVSKGDFVWDVAIVSRLLDVRSFLPCT